MGSPHATIGGKPSAERDPDVTIFQAIVLGITQGLTEFAPVSSSGHLILVPWLFHWPILTNESLNKTFDVALHMGTFVGAVVYFRRDIGRYLVAWIHSIRARAVSTMDERFAWFLVVGTLPGAAAGALFEDVIEHKLGQPWLIALMLAVFALVLYAVDTRSDSARSFGDMTWRDTIVIGVAQAIALQPGVSRSGVTMTAARGLGIDRESAARFSFLLSLPIIGGAGVFKAAKVFSGGGLPAGFAGAFLSGTVASAVSGFLMIWGLLSYLRRRDYKLFVVYRIAAALFVLGIIASNVRPATIG